MGIALLWLSVQGSHCLWTPLPSLRTYSVFLFFHHLNHSPATTTIDKNKSFSDNIRKWQQSNNFLSFFLFFFGSRYRHAQPLLYFCKCTSETNSVIRGNKDGRFASNICIDSVCSVIEVTRTKNLEKKKESCFSVSINPML